MKILDSCVDCSDKYGKNPLYHAIKIDGKSDVIRMLIENQCDVNVRDMSEKRMPLAVSKNTLSSLSSSL